MFRKNSDFKRILISNSFNFQIFLATESKRNTNHCDRNEMKYLGTSDIDLTPLIVDRSIILSTSATQRWTTTATFCSPRCDGRTLKSKTSATEIAKVGGTAGSRDENQPITVAALLLEHRRSPPTPSPPPPTDSEYLLARQGKCSIRCVVISFHTNLFPRQSLN